MESSQANETYATFEQFMRPLNVSISDYIMKCEHYFEQNNSYGNTGWGFRPHLNDCLRLQIY